MLNINPWNMVMIVINLLVLYAIFRKFLYKPVMNVIHRREELIQGQFDSAKKTQDDALQLKADYERKIFIYGNCIGVIVIFMAAIFLYKRRKDIAEVIRNIKIKELIFVIAVMGTLGIVVACIQGAYLGEMTLSIQRMAMIVAVIFLVIIIAMSVMFVYVVNSRKILMEINDLNEECMKYQKNYYERLITEDSELRAFRHDVNKHYNAISALLNEMMLSRQETM